MLSAPTTTMMSGFSSRTRLSDWKIASALPRYQCLPTRCWAGTGVTWLPSIVDIRQVWVT